MRKSLMFIALLILGVSSNIYAAKKNEKPNIVVIFGDDIGWFNISAYNMGMMGYRTPNIDRIAHDGMMFTDYYGEQSCTAGRAAFMTGQIPVRTGLTKVGIPGARVGLQAEDPTIAELLKPHGYVCGQFGKNHFGDRDEFLPTNHGFDEFYGNLYHLNAEEEPEHAMYPKDPAFRKKFGPRGVIHSFADGRIEDTGSLTIKRMETCDEEFKEAGFDFMERAVKSKKPFFVWMNATRMHVNTHLKDASKNKTDYGIYADGMVEHDQWVGEILDKLKELKVDENTIVIYTTDNGAEVFSWPDGGTTPFNGEKNTSWEGGFRVPCMIKWPGHIKPYQVSNEIVSAQDWLPTILAATGDDHVKQDLLKGKKVGDKTFNVHIDGFNMLPYLTGKEKKGPRDYFFYFTDDGKLAALRMGDWKLMFLVQEATGFDVWGNPFTPLRLPKIYNLRMDPFERADEESVNYDKWMFDNIFYLYMAQDKTAEFLKTFLTYPPRQRPGSFNVDEITQRFLSPKN
ncbi:arylsulfatase [Halosquirtibacter laminarini]|uniref:Arylsulfatase n=1 Tax=Halosquirtibacter laminarini TaxID=3374600 RepID=A0AC61NKA2_9BACT|nr:arylsulfatase [Prolixibacteraceae bacterium]